MDSDEFLKLYDLVRRGEVKGLAAAGAGAGGGLFGGGGAARRNSFKEALKRPTAPPPKPTLLDRYQVKSRNPPSTASR